LEQTAADNTVPTSLYLFSRLDDRLLQKYQSFASDQDLQTRFFATL
jgi:hypothetical protein